MVGHGRRAERHGRAVGQRSSGSADPPRHGAQRRVDGRPRARGRGRGARRRGHDWADIDAVVIGKAPDMFEGVAMPELYLADALGAVGKPMMRVHTAGSVGGSTAIVAAKLVMAGHPRAGAHRRVREAVGEQRHVGPVGADAVPGAARRRRRRLLRAAHPRVHAPVGRAAPHRPPRRGEGPARPRCATRRRTCTCPTST